MLGEAGGCPSPLRQEVWSWALPPAPCSLTAFLPECLETLGRPGRGPHIRGHGTGRRPAARPHCLLQAAFGYAGTKSGTPLPLRHSLMSVPPALQSVAGWVLCHTADQAVYKNPSFGSGVLLPMSVVRGELSLPYPFAPPPPESLHLRPRTGSRTGQTAGRCERHACAVCMNAYVAA